MDQLKSVAFAVALAGGAHDLFTKRIPNWLTVPAILLGVTANLVLLGAEGVLWSLAGGLLPFLALWPVYAAGWAGAGDVKLLMAVGAIGGFTYGWQVMAAAFAAAAVWGFFDVLFRGRLLIFFREMFRFLKSVVTPGVPLMRPELDKNRKTSFGVFVALAAVGVILWGHYGAS